MQLRIGFLVSLVALYLLGTRLAGANEPAWVLPALMGLVFVGLVIAMYVRLIPALLALPILAVALASIAGMRWDAIFGTVIQEGSVRLAPAILAAIMGSILAQVVEKTGIAQTAIKKTAELGGDRPMILAVLLTLVVALLFVTLGGLGAVIMVATIVIPILLSLGLRPLYVGCLFLLAMSLGGVFNVANWQLYIDVLEMSAGQITYFALPFSGLMLLALLAFLVIEGKRMGKARFKAEVTTGPESQHQFVRWYALLTPVAPLIPVLVFALIPRFYPRKAEVTATLPEGLARTARVVISPRNVVADTPVKPFSLKNGELGIIRHEGEYIASVQLPSSVVFIPPPAPQSFNAAIWKKTDIQVAHDPATGRLTVTPATASTTYEFPIVVALLLGILYGAVSTWRRGQSTVQLLTKASFDGVAAVGPALVLMVGIGMVLKAVSAEQVTGIIQPLLVKVVPHHTGGAEMARYVVLLGVLAPLALYRGPLNLWGMGTGTIALLKGLMPAGAILGAFMSVGMIQGVCDPTNTHNVWIANYTNTDVQDILKRTLPYMWMLAVIGLILGGVLYYL